MRNFKKFLALALAMLMLVGMTAITTGAAEEADYSDAAQKLASIGILKGDTNGNLMLDQGVTRWHTALFFVQALTGKTDGAEWNETKTSDFFTDVPEYGTAIDFAAGMGLIKGRGNGIYGYADSIIYQDMLVMAVRALGYETADMSYPYGHIQAAEKLGLTEDVSVVNFATALTRGETAQIIWNMLGTQIAAEDPLTGKILYPGEVSMTNIVGKFDIIVRETLLEKAGFSQDVIESTIVEFTEGKTSKDISTVELENGLVLNAADLGITAKTRKDTYLGLPVKLYINCKLNDFERYYEVEEEGEEKVIFTEFTPTTSVINLGEETNIKYTPATETKAASITLGGTRFSEDKYIFDVRLLDMDGWIEADERLLENFTYDTKEGHIGGNSYGEIRYAVLTDAETDEQTLLMLYMPFAFGRYQSRSIRYQPTVSDMSFVLIGTYDKDKTITDKSGRKGTHFIERPVGENFVTDGVIVDENTLSLSKRDGEAACTVTVTGTSVKNNEFMFYYYNEPDNVLYVAATYGSSKNGVLSSYSEAKETVKIDGKTYGFGFPGSFEDHEMPGYSVSNVQTLLNRLTAGEKNASYIAVGDNLVFLGGVDNTKDAKQHSFVILRNDAEIMAELLDIKEEKYEAGLVEGLYRDENGNVAVAALNISTGKWELAAVQAIEYGDYDDQEDEFTDSLDFAECLENYNLFGDSFNLYADFTEMAELLTSEGIFLVRQNKSKVYTLACINEETDECIEYGVNPLNDARNGYVNANKGLVFSDAAAKTNLLRGIKDTTVDAARVTMTAKSVVAVINALGEVGVRVGIQGEDNSILQEECPTADGLGGFDARFYSATKSLIVVKLGNDYDVRAWEEADAFNADETYYIALNGAETEYERLEDDTYNVTLSGLFDLKTFKAVSPMTVNVENLDEHEWATDLAAGTILHLAENGDMLVVEDMDEALLAATDLRDEKDEAFASVDMSEVAFKDADTFEAPELHEKLDGDMAVAEINITLATIDLTDEDFESDLDVDDMIYFADYDEDDAAAWGGIPSVELDDGRKVYVYTMSEFGKVTEINAPTAGVLDQYILDVYAAGGSNGIYSEADETYFEPVTVTLYAAGQFDEETGVLNLYVLKTLRYAT